MSELKPKTILENLKNTSLANKEVWLEPGEYQWIVPMGINSILITACGGGSSSGIVGTSQAGEPTIIGDLVTLPGGSAVTQLSTSYATEQYNIFMSLSGGTGGGNSGALATRKADGRYLYYELDGAHGLIGLGGRGLSPENGGANGSESPKYIGGGGSLGGGGGYGGDNGYGGPSIFGPGKGNSYQENTAWNEPELFPKKGLSGGPGAGAGVRCTSGYSGTAGAGGAAIYKKRYAVMSGQVINITVGRGGVYNGTTPWFFSNGGDGYVEIEW